MAPATGRFSLPGILVGGKAARRALLLPRVFLQRPVVAPG